MLEQIIIGIQQEMSCALTQNQLALLGQVLTKHLSPVVPSEPAQKAEESLLPAFIAAKRVEGCSEKSLRYYESTIRNMLDGVGKTEKNITTEDLRGYLDNYQRRGSVSKVTLDNVRRILSTFFSRLQISGVEIRLRKIGKDLNFNKVHPHKFRRTLATMAIDKGMPIEQVQQLLGHQSIDTTLQYAMVNQANVKNSCRKFLG